MGQIASAPNLRVEDFPGQKDWIGRLFEPINRFFLDSSNTLNGNVTLGDNIPTQTSTLSFTHGGDTDFPRTLAWTLRAAPVEVRIAKATENSVPVILVFSWSYANGVLFVNDIRKINSASVSELTRGASYNITLRGNF